MAFSSWYHVRGLTVKKKHPIDAAISILESFGACERGERCTGWPGPRGPPPRLRALSAALPRTRAARRLFPPRARCRARRGGTHQSRERAREQPDEGPQDGDPGGFAAHPETRRDHDTTRDSARGARFLSRRAGPRCRWAPSPPRDPAGGRRGGGAPVGHTAGRPRGHGGPPPSSGGRPGPFRPQNRRSSRTQSAPSTHPHALDAALPALSPGRGQDDDWGGARKQQRRRGGANVVPGLLGRAKVVVHPSDRHHEHRLRQEVRGIADSR